VKVLFGLLCGVDGLIAAILVFFFLWGLADGTVSSFNIGLWLSSLFGVAVILVGGIALSSYGQRAVGSAVLAILAFPGLLYGLLLLALIALSPDWK
jgi:hypothetical protein